MKRLGISIYPEKTSREELFNYLDRAADAGFTRIFSCLLSVKDDRDSIKKEFLEINRYAHNKGFEIVLDCNPRVFKELGISYDDLSFFKEIECDGIRLDEGFGGNPEAAMTFNPQGLMIEINMSSNVPYLDTIMSYKPDTNHLIGCHNFYPHGYSGLGLDFFKKCTERFNKYGLRTAAFVSSQAENTFGPWPVSDGIPTLEMHRHLPMHVQIEHYISLGTIDDVIISNCYPTDEELAKVKSLPRNVVCLDVVPIDNLPALESDIVFDFLHANRGDTSEYLVRSSQTRVKYAGNDFKLINPAETIHRGDVVIDSSSYGSYAGEMQIALKDMKNTGKTSVVGHVVDCEHFLLDSLEPWQRFRLCRA